MSKQRKPLARYTSLRRSAKGLTRTPLSPGKTRLKRSRLRKVSKQKKARDAANGPMLDEYRKLFPRCQYCGRRKATDIHEMFSQGRRHIARAHRSCILHLCRWCHETVLQGSAPAFQMAVKMRADKLGFDLAQYNDLTPGDKVTMREIDDVLDAEARERVDA